MWYADFEQTIEFSVRNTRTSFGAHAGVGALVNQIADFGPREETSRAMPMQDEESLVGVVAQAARPLHGSALDLDPLMARIGDARLVLVGEASHGTHDFYRWRAELTKRLLIEKG